MSHIAAGSAEGAEQGQESSGKERTVGLLLVLLVALVHSSGETSVNGPERCWPSAVWRRASCSTGRAASTWGRSCTA